MAKILLKSTADRLNIHDESVLRKTEEFLRLYQAKTAVKSLNEQAKVILCLDLASTNLGLLFDRDTAQCLSGLKSSIYRNNFNNIEKILGLNKILTIGDVCIQLGCTAVKEDATNILNKIKENTDIIIDLEHPQYVVAATYLAAKNKKIQIDKSKLITISRLKNSQWKELISNFEKLGINSMMINCDNSKSNFMANKPKKNNNIQEENDEIIIEENYEVWKERILKEAYAALNKNEKMEC